MSRYDPALDALKVTPFQSTLARAVMTILPVGNRVENPLDSSKRYDQIRDLLVRDYPNVTLTLEGAERMLGGYFVRVIGNASSLGPQGGGGVFDVVILNQSHEVARYQCNFFTPQKGGAA